MNRFPLSILKAFRFQTQEELRSNIFRTGLGLSTKIASRLRHFRGKQSINCIVMEPNFLFEVDKPYSAVFLASYDRFLGNNTNVTYPQM